MGSESLFKVFRAAEWAHLEREGLFPGSPDDLRDGFIHLSTAAQLPGTRARHFAGEADVVVAEVLRDEAVEAHLRWEPSRDGQLFPHLYAPLRRENVVRV